MDLLSFFPKKQLWNVKNLKGQSKLVLMLLTSKLHWYDMTNPWWAKHCYVNRKRPHGIFKIPKRDNENVWLFIYKCIYKDLKLACWGNFHEMSILCRSCLYLGRKFVIQNVASCFMHYVAHATNSATKTRFNISQNFHSSSPPRNMKSTSLKRALFITTSVLEWNGQDFSPQQPDYEAHRPELNTGGNYNDHTDTQEKIP